MKSNYESAQLLRFFFEQKRKFQPGYSLRALSRDLTLSQSYVSEIFSGKKLPSAKKIPALASLLGMDGFARQQYEESLLNDLFPVETKKNKWIEKKWDHITIGNGNVLRKWYYLVIVDLIDCRGFRSDPAWIAKRIGIKTHEAFEALTWLRANKFIAEKNGVYSRTLKKLRFNTAKSLPEIRAYHRQMMELAIAELTQKTDRESFARRLITGVTFSCDPQKVELAKRRLAEAMYAVADELMDGDCTEVYQINVQIFPHTTPAVTDR